MHTKVQCHIFMNLWLITGRPHNVHSYKNLTWQDTLHYPKHPAIYITTPEIRHLTTVPSVECRPPLFMWKNSWADMGIHGRKGIAPLHHFSSHFLPSHREGPGYKQYVCYGGSICPRVSYDQVVYSDYLQHFLGERAQLVDTNKITRIIYATNTNTQLHNTKNKHKFTERRKPHLL